MRGAAAFILMAATATFGGAAGAEDAAELKRGEALLTQNCARCHAVGRSGVSPHHLAPPFRTLSRHYAIDSLQEALAEGLVSGHPDMPEFRFEPADVGAILAYLKSIQDK